MKIGADVAQELLEIDIGALAAIVDTLYRCYRKTAVSNEFPTLLAHLRDAIDHPRWTERVAYFHALWALIDKEDPAQARSDLAPLDISAVDDPEILALYVHVHSDHLGFEERIVLFDRMLTVAQDPSYRLQYSAAKGIAFCLITETDKGCQIMRDAIDQYRALDSERHSSYGDFRLAQALFILAELTGDQETASEALSAYRKLWSDAKQDDFTREYFADLAKGLGDCHSLLAQYAEAIERYDESLQFAVTELTKVFLARAHANAGAQDAARSLLNEIDIAGFSDPNMCDYAISWALLAAISLEQIDLDRAIREIKQAKTLAPLLAQQKAAILIDLLETRPRDSSGRIHRLLATLNRYISLNPNILGIGVNLNKVLEDFEARSNPLCQR